MKKILFLFLGLFAASACWAATERMWDYPFVNQYEATVLGTPTMYMAPVPPKVPVRQFELTVFDNRRTPEVFWYLDKLKCSLVYQDKKAPLVFNIAGTGAGYNSGKMIYMQRALYAAGFHVISLSSPTHPDFIVSASESMVPGNIVEDAEDLYRVIKLAMEEVGGDIEVSEFYLTGYSLGAAQAAFVSKLDEERGLFNFKKVLMINPPVSLYNSVGILDDMLENGIPGGPENFPEFFDRFFAVISSYYNKTGQLDITDPDFLYDVYKYSPPKDTTLEALIGISFRLSSSGMIFTADVMNDGGYVVPQGAVLTTGTSLTDLFLVCNRTSFEDYYHEYFYPYFRSREPGLAEQTLIERISLKSIAHYLRTAAKIGLMTNEDDIILAPGEIDFFEEVFGDRAKIYPTGGHCGNMQYKWFVQDMLDFFNN